MRCNQVWSCDITYIRLQCGFVYLMAVMDWFSRYVLSWELSITLDTSFCLEALDRALRVATPEIFNSDQGVQFTSAEFTTRLKDADIRISWDGRGRALDNIFVERLWRSVKYEEVYIKEYQSVADAVSNLRAYFTFYNHERLHQALNYQTPAQVYTTHEEARRATFRAKPLIAPIGERGFRERGSMCSGEFRRLVFGKQHVHGESPRHKQRSVHSG